MVKEALVLGGGMAGGSAALELARSGIPVRLLEREAGPHHKVCGEFLSVEAQRDLARIGFDVARLGAVSVDTLCVARGARRIEIPLPFVALGISRLRLDEALLETAEQAGARIERGVKVSRIVDGEVHSNAGSCRAAHLLLATGKHDVRGAPRGEAPADDSPVGFKMHWRVAPGQARAMGGAIELVLFDGGYAGLQLVADDIVNLCLIVRRSRLMAAGGSWQGLLRALMEEEHIVRRLGDAEPLFSRPLTISNLPYGHVCDSDAEGYFRLGDQGALTAPLTGDGMAIAVRSARLAVACIASGGNPAYYRRQLWRTVAPQIGRAMLLQRLGDSRVALPLAFGVLGIWPGLGTMVARMTRLPDRSAA